MLASLGILSGCANLQGPPLGTPEQLKALAGDKNVVAYCVNIVGTGGAATVVAITDDKGTITAGSVTMDPNCKTTITHLPKEPKP